MGQINTNRIYTAAAQGNIMALKASISAHWKNTVSSLWNLSYFIGTIPQVIAYAWIGQMSNDPVIISYLLIGGPLMSVWHAVVFGIATILIAELRGRTLEFNMISKTPILVVLFSKSLAQVIFGIPAGTLAFLTMLAVARQLPVIDSIPLLVVSLLFVLLSLTSTGLLFAPIISLSGRTSASFSPIIPIIVTLSGFLFPIDLLPKELEVLARLTPSSWAMSSVLQSLKGSTSIWNMVSNWGYSLLLSIVYLALTLVLFRLYERRLRVTGSMSYF
jgi:ABC-2 type transport system permease protein